MTPAVGLSYEDVLRHDLGRIRVNPEVLERPHRVDALAENRDRLLIENGCRCRRHVGRWESRHGGGALAKLIAPAIGKQSAMSGWVFDMTTASRRKYRTGDLPRTTQCQPKIAMGAINTWHQRSPSSGTLICCVISFNSSAPPTCAGRKPGTPAGVAARRVVSSALRAAGVDPFEQRLA
jgi:hypothetical protein